jgi:circadian clock protein KaiC
MVSTGLEELDRILGRGYPERSSILVAGPPGIGKEAIPYRFIQSGLEQGDFCLYVTRLSAGDVREDMAAFGIDLRQEPVWMAAEGSELKCDVNDLAGLSSNIKDVLRKNADRRIRVVTDTLSSLLILNAPETVYRFVAQLLADVKQYSSVLLATAEDGMHDPKVLAAMEQLFEGVLELKLYEDGLRVVPLLRIRKMRGVPPQPGYYNFVLGRGKMEVTTRV